MGRILSFKSHICMHVFSNLSLPLFGGLKGTLSKNVFSKAHSGRIFGKSGISPSVLPFPQIKIRKVWENTGYSLSQKTCRRCEKSSQSAAGFWKCERGGWSECSGSCCTLGAAATQDSVWKPRPNKSFKYRIVALPKLQFLQDLSCLRSRRMDCSVESYNASFSSHLTSF